MAFQKKTVRSTKAQIKYLCQYMAEHADFAAGDFKTPQGAAVMERQWLRLKEALDEIGPARSVDQWKVCWRDQKRKARVEGGALNKAMTATGNAVDVPELSQNSQIILETKGVEMAIGCGPPESPIGVWEYVRCVPGTNVCLRESTEERSLLRETNSEESNNESPISHGLNRTLSRDSNSHSGSESFRMPKRHRGMQDLKVAKKQMDEAFSIINNRSHQVDSKKQLNECDLYGQLLSEKLKILDIDHRLVLMNEIDNLVFKHIMNARKRGSAINPKPSSCKSQ